MNNHQQDFLSLAIKLKALRFGEFTLKSKRKSPYFFDAGVFNTGNSLSKLGHHYAKAIIDANINFDMLFGPAYKGIPLVTATAIALSDHFSRDIPWCFNRKEEKDRGEGGTTIGAPLAGKVLIIDDVITAGTTMDETMVLLKKANATPAGIVIALDRQEGGCEKTESACGVPVKSIVRLDDLLVYLSHKGGMESELAAIHAYRMDFLRVG